MKHYISHRTAISCYGIFQCLRRVGQQSAVGILMEVPCHCFSTGAQRTITMFKKTTVFNVLAASTVSSMTLAEPGDPANPQLHQHEISVEGPSDSTVDDLNVGFVDPPVLARPGAYWNWLNGDVSLPGLTRDLEEAKTKGLGGLEKWNSEAMRTP